MIKYIHVFHHAGCAEGAHSLKLMGSILNVTFYVMARRVSYKDVANNIAPCKISEPGTAILIRTKSTNKKTTARWFNYLVEMGGMMKYIHVFHPVGCTENVHSKLLRSILVNPLHGFRTFPLEQTKKGYPDNG